MVCLTGDAAALLAVSMGCGPFRARAHLALCASAIFRRDAADMILVGTFAVFDVPVPFSDSSTEIA
jgi:hypothetical protein